jgi:enamine deaminase RidA (YjgF/YER057c/UK114 family)
VSDEEHPYSPALVAAGMVYVSGALSVDAEGRPVPGRRPALDAALDRLAERLATVGAALSDVVRATYYVTDVSLREEANQQYLDRFTAPRSSTSRRPPLVATTWCRCTTTSSTPPIRRPSWTRRLRCSHPAAT